MIFGTCKLHTTRSGVMQILSKFCHNEHLTRKMAPLRINTTDAYTYRWLRTMNPSTGNPALIFWRVGQWFVCTKFCWEIPSESGESSSLCIRNAFMTILSSRVILPIKMHKCVVIQQCYFYKKQVVIHKKYYYKLKG